jgi:putative membrane protein
MIDIPIAWGGLPILGGLGLLFWILLIVAVVALVRGSGPANRASGGQALQLLEERYARGEITREEFVERRTVLGGGSNGS